MKKIIILLSLLCCNCATNNGEIYTLDLHLYCDLSETKEIKANFNCKYSSESHL